MAALRRRLRTAGLLGFAMAAALAAPAAAAGPDVRGAATHPLWGSSALDDSAREFDLLQGAHANAVRFDLGWSTLESDGKGRLSDWYVKKADAVFAQARARGLKVLVTFWTTPCWASSAPASVKQDCTGAWWDRGVDRYPPRDPEEFARAAAWVVDRWGDDMVALEIWNEPNWNSFFTTQTPAADYAGLLRASYRQVKQADPEMTVLGPGMLMSDVPFLEALYAEGIKGYFDGLSIHPFNFGRAPYDPATPNGPKYSYSAGVPWVRETMEKHGDGDKGIWFTEFGWSSCAPQGTSSWCITPETQAQYIADAFRMMRERWPWVKGAFVYNLRNKGTNVADRESQMGMVYRDFTPKPSYGAFAATLEELARPESPMPDPPAEPAPASDPPPREPPAPVASTVFADPVPPPPAPPGPARDSLAPALSAVAVTPRRIASRRAARNASVGWNLSEAATIDLRFERLVAGRMAGGRCVAPARAAPRARVCRRPVAALSGVTVRAARSGPGRVRLIPAGRPVVAGVYVVRARATDAAGNRSVPATARFSVARPARR